MNRLESLQKAQSKKQLAKILGLNASFLTRTLYIRQIDSQYKQFEIPKRNGGFRTINAPMDELKDIQIRLSQLLLDCIDEINKSKNIVPKLSHGFTRNRSIISNAENHINRKNVLNIDLSNFFGSFNFGRVRGFFIKNRNFLLHKDIATVIAKISCLNNSLPQGSPCSPVITNLIAHPLDIRLASLAKRNSCIYTRYADDITFSTRDNEFNPEIIKMEEFAVLIGNNLRKEIERAGFKINDKKTRVQFWDSRQDVTGLVVNEKVNIKREYWKTTRSMCHKLFTTGAYIKITPNGEVEGTIGELQGRLNFIDSVDKYNRNCPKGPIDHKYQNKNNGLDYRALLNVREKIFSKFLYYRNFYANDKPTILCEGHTDYIYLRSAISILAKQYPLLANEKEGPTQYELLVNFLNYSKRTRYLLDLYGGGSYIKKFTERYQENFKFYQKTIPINPVILLLDNDSGPDALLDHLITKKSKYSHCSISKEDIRSLEFIHITSNLYLVLTPRIINDKPSMMENFFDESTLSILVDGRKFDPDKDADSTTSYGKNTFATKVVQERKATISFEGFKPLLSRVERVIQYHNSLLSS